MNPETRAILGFNDIWLRIFLAPVVGIMMSFLFNDYDIGSGFMELLRLWFIGYIITLSYWEGSRFLTIQSRKRIPGIENTRKRIFWQILAILIYTLIISFTILTLVSRFLPNHFEIDKTFYISIVMTLMVVFLFVTIYESIYMYSSWKKEFAEKELAKREQIKAELQGLRDQLNPHFLFNSLNTLMNLVSEDQQMAESYLQKLSQVFRYVLDSRNEQLCDLSTELTFLENYIYIQKERFKNNLHTEINIPSQYKQMKIVPLAMQLLLENAIKHNIISSASPLHISIYIEDDRLYVKNNLQPKKQIQDSTKLGIENIKKRYAFFTDEKLIIDDSDGCFTVGLPLLKID